jgi:hypothetical protein
MDGIVACRNCGKGKRLTTFYFFDPDSGDAIGDAVRREGASQPAREPAQEPEARA